MPQEHLEYAVRAHESNTRLDTLVSRLLPAGSVTGRNAVGRALRSGDITVNGAPAKPTYRVKTGDRIMGTVTSPESDPGTAPDPSLRLPIVFENRHFIVIDKPAGILTHPTRTGETGTVANWAIDHDPKIAGAGENPLRPGIVHRLDRDTSGLLVIAKTQDAFQVFKDAFQRHEIKKAYLALVHGHIKPETGLIDVSIARDWSGSRRTVTSENRKTRGKVRPALTEYAVLGTSGHYDLVELGPKTGRTHQIRVHLASINHPVVGDRLYGTKATRAHAKTFPRHLLHAARLEFTLFGERYAFDSPLPNDWPQGIATETDHP